MVELGHPWLLAVLPLPVLVWLVLPPYRERRAAVRIPFFEQAAGAGEQRPARGAVVLRRNAVQWLLAPLIWVLLVVALARPQWVEPPIERTETARDLLLAVDLSGSMEKTDFVDPDGKRLRRVDAVKAVLDDFVARREGDRLGLVLFGNAAHLQVPFTRDHDLYRTLLEGIDVGMVGPQTMIGEAIGLSIKLFEESEAERKVVVLLTDGNDSGSRVPPSKAASIAAEHGIVLHAVAMGDPQTKGSDRVDLDVLRALADETGGSTFLASDRQELEAIYATLDEIEPLDIETISHRPKRPLFHWPLGAALGLGLTYQGGMIGLSAARRRRPPGA